VSFSREIYNGVEATREYFRDRAWFADVPANEIVAGIGSQIAKALGVSSVGQFIKIDDVNIATGGKEMSYEI